MATNHSFAYKHLPVVGSGTSSAGLVAVVALEPLGLAVSVLVDSDADGSLSFFAGFGVDSTGTHSLSFAR